MRKRLGILILIFCLFLFFPTQKTYGQWGGGSYGGSWGTRELEGALIGFLIFLPIWAIASYFSEDKKCNTLWHPGDYYYEKNYKIIKPIKMKALKCHNNCEKKSMEMNVAMGSLRSNKGVSHNQCYKPCAIDAYKPFPTSVATCKYEGVKGHYSDGSFYYSSGNLIQLLLKNRHELKDKYEKTEWQKARDECMELTSKKKKGFELPMSYHERLFGLYNDCLKERGF